MILSTVYTLLFFFAVIVDINQCSDDCFYHPGHPGKKCYDPRDHTKFICCPLTESCQDGQCRSFTTPSSKALSTETSLFIGIGVSIFAILCFVLGIVYWRHQQQKTPQNKPNFLASFSRSRRATSSAGVRIRSSTSGETSIKLQTLPTNISVIEKT